VLTDAAGTLIADHEVRLDATCWQHGRSPTTRLPVWNVTQTKRARDESRITRELGAWIGAQVLGPVRPPPWRTRPVTVRVAFATGRGVAGVPAPGARARWRQAARRPGRHLVMDTAPNTARAARHRWATGSACSACSASPRRQATQPPPRAPGAGQLIERIAANGRAADVRVSRRVTR